MLQVSLDQLPVDILPALKSGDSYGALGWISLKSLRWVPAAGGIAAPLTSQANRVCPTLFANYAAAKIAWPRVKHQTLKRLCRLRLISPP